MPDKNLRNRSILSVNIAVMFFGLAGLFAKWIHLPALAITFGRVFFSSITLGLFMLVRKQSFRLTTKRDFFLLLLAGGVLALHWWSFLESIQLSTVAIGTITFSTFPLFVTFLEPLLFRQKLKHRSIIIAAVILAGVFITIPEFSLENYMFRGILVGMISALTYAVLTIVNKILANKYSSTLTAFYEQAAAAVILLPLMINSGVQPGVSDLILLLFLGIVTTALAHTMFISGLKHIPAQLAGICSMMETVYSIFFAMIFFGEIPSVREVIGAVIIIVCVLIETGVFTPKRSLPRQE